MSQRENFAAQKIFGVYFRLIKMIPAATKAAAPTTAVLICSPITAQPRISPKTGVTKEKLATDAAG